MSSWNHYLLGSSYYPEWWPEEQWAGDFGKMRGLGFNTVRMGEFAWSTFEPAEGRFETEWMQRAIALAHEHDIGVVLCTPTATAPAWLRQAHPDILGGNEKGSFDFGGRKGWCLSSTAYRNAARRVVEHMAQVFGDSPGVIGWQLDNEPGYPFQCFDPNCRRAFQEWLCERYGSLEALNLAWCTSFWSQTYSDWAQIEFPLNRGCGAWNPGQRLDYHRFFSHQFASFLREQITILRQHVGTRFISTNWPNTYWSVDCFDMGLDLDATGWDNYNVAPGISPPLDQYGSCIHHDLARNCGAHQRWFCAEQAAQVPAHAMPEGIRLQTWLDVAHGGVGTIFFEWRPPLGGQEQGYLSVLQPDGSLGPAGDVHRRLGEELGRIGPVLAGARTEADVAMIYSYENQWEQGWWRSDGKGYDADAQIWYQGLKSLQRDVDIIPSERDFSRYRVIAAPNLRIVEDGLAPRMRRWVEEGGVLILNHQAGTRDSVNRIRPLIGPGVFQELAGVRVPHSVSRDAMVGQLMLGRDDQDVSGLKIVFPGGESYEPASILEGIELIGAETLATFTGGRMTGRPAVTAHRVGKGLVLYAGSDSKDVAFYRQLVTLAAGHAGLSPLLPATPDVCLTRRVKEGREYIFCCNLGVEAQEVTLPGRMHELISQRDVSGTVQLDALDVMVLHAR